MNLFRLTPASNRVKTSQDARDLMFALSGRGGVKGRARIAVGIGVVSKGKGAGVRA